MPLLTASCAACATPIDYLSPREPMPERCACGGTMRPAITTPGLVGVAVARGSRARVGTRPEITATAGVRVTEETATFRVREKGTSAVLVDWRCTACAVAWFDTYAERPATPPPCQTCGGLAEEVLGVPDAGWFEKEHPHGYFDQGLGCFVRSRAHRRQIMEERGLIELGECGDVSDDLNRKRSDQARCEDEEVRGMLRGMEHGEGSAALKHARDRGEILPWDWAIDAVGGLDKR